MMGKHCQIIGMIYILLNGITLVSSSYDNDLRVAVANLIDGLSNFKVTTRPVDDASAVLDVNVTWNLVSIIDFDEANGFIEVSGYLTLKWRPTAYADIVTGLYMGTEAMPNTDLWKPPILLVNSLKYFDEVGSDTKVKIEYDFVTQTCTWKPWLITRVACSPNVQYYPFDKQSCSLRFSVWSYTSSEVKLKSLSADWTFNFFEENGEWVVSNTTVEDFDVNGMSTIDFKIDLTRRPLYYIVNLLAPVVLLGVLNSFTFLLPTASGERVGFTVTCFLSYVVVLNTIMMYLPTSSTPFSNLSYYTFIMMLFSAGVSLMTILTIRIHHKDDTGKVPKCLAAFFRCLTCKCKHKRSGQVRPSNNVVTVWDTETEQITHTRSETKEDTSSSREDEVKWSEVALFLDSLMFLGFLGGQAFFSVGYLVPLFLGGN